MIEVETFVAVEQYKKYGQIIPCEDCANFNNKSCSGAYGFCTLLKRTMKKKEFCCYGKQKEVDDAV